MLIACDLTAWTHGLCRLARYLTAAGVAAARAALSGEADGAPKARDGAAEALRALRGARRRAVKARTQAANPAPGPDRLRARGATGPFDRVEHRQTSRARGPVPCQSRRRPDRGHQGGDALGGWPSLGAAAEIARLDTAMAALLAHAASQEFLDKQGVGPQVAAALLAAVADNPQRPRCEASFAALCGRPRRCLLGQAGPSPFEPGR